MKKTQIDYPPTVTILKNIVNAKEIKETHISYVLLADEYVYKVKKSVDLGFLNYRELKSRRIYTVLEKELNERFSNGIYLEALKLIRKNAQEFALVPLSNSLPALDYVLKMKRIDDRNFLEYYIKNDMINCEDMQKIGEEVFNILNSLESITSFDELIDTTKTGISFNEVVEYNAKENFQQTETFNKTFIEPNYYDFIKNKTEDFLSANKDLFNSSYNLKFIKNGHGDIRLDHIYKKGNEIGLIDCIEFNKRFRYADLKAEAAFLSLSLDYMHISNDDNKEQVFLDLSDAFLKGFLKGLAEAKYSSSNLKLLNYYRSYYSFVRAKVSCFLLAEKTVEWSGYKAKFDELSTLIKMSATYLASVFKNIVIITYGLMASGKSTISSLFSKQFPVKRFSSDEERKILANISKNTKVYEAWGVGIYNKNFSLNLYSHLGRLAKGELQLGRIPLIDASFSNIEYFNTFINELAEIEDIHIVKVLCKADEETVKNRLETRETLSNEVSDGRLEIYSYQKENANLIEADITIDTTQPIDDNILKIFNHILSI